MKIIFAVMMGLCLAVSGIAFVRGEVLTAIYFILSAIWWLLFCDKGIR
jgi:hypothetical protein